jgi:adenine/guanine phosphoribosyltransferase-like PRPP-binding protein
MLHYDSSRGLSDLAETVQKTIRALVPHLGEFDSIAVQGTSGLLIGAPVALKLDKALVIVREDAELQCWHSHDVENAANAGERVLFLDDQISSGATLRDVKDKLAKHTHGQVTATYLYQYDEYTRDRERNIPRQRTRAVGGAHPHTVTDRLSDLLRGNPWA